MCLKVQQNWLIRQVKYSLVKLYMHLKVGELAIIEIYLLQKEYQQHSTDLDTPIITKARQYGKELKGEKRKLDTEDTKQKPR